MSDHAIGEGYYLAELIKNYHTYRAEYLDWATEYSMSQGEAIRNYQRALLAWYEARINTDHTYTGEPYTFIIAAASYYAGQPSSYGNQVDAQATTGLTQNPLDYLPKGVELTQVQTRMLQQYRELSKNCQELLLLAYYHCLSDQKIGEVLDLGEAAQRATDKRRKCLLLVRERWQQTGLLDPVYVATPEQLSLIDRYRRNELDVAERWEVDALRTSDRVFSDAMLLREDLEYCLRLAGRQDTLETLAREEAEYKPKPSTIKPRTKGWLPGTQIKGMQTYMIGALIAVLCWLILTTFGPDRKDRLYNNYFTPFPNITQGNQRALDPVEEDLADMLIPYDQADYFTAYNEILPAANAYPSAPLYLGVCALALDEPQRAMQWLDQYLPGDRYYPYARWYTALAYLKGGRQPAALGILVEIVGTAGHPYEEQAADLIEALER